jgi:hypothetical protein
VSDNAWHRQPETGGGPHHEEEELESYAGGEIQVRPGKVNRWLMIVYFALFAWALYYLFTYWGGLGPGLAY